MSDPAAQRPLLIHAGFHKTGTTWLQNLVFLPEHGFHQALDHEAIFDHVIHPHDLAFDPAPAREALARGRSAAPAGTQVDVLSLEALSGLPYDGARESASYARRLHAVAPGARILFTIREQGAILASTYMQHLYRAGTLPPRRFFHRARPKAPGDLRGYMRFDPEMYFYHRLVGLYQDLFGAENVLVVPLESIAADQAAVVRQIATFSGNAALAGRDWRRVTERGTSYPQWSAPILRRINHFRQGPLNRNPVVATGPFGDLAYKGAGWTARRLPLPRAWAKARPVERVARARYAGLYAESNRRLAEMLAHPADLSAYEGMRAGD